MKKHTECLVCESKSIRQLPHYYEKKGLIKCDNCQFVFMEQIPTQEELTAHYEIYCYDDDAGISPATEKSYHILLDEFERYRQTNQLLDVGCGRGWFLEAAKKRGWHVYGTEYSEKALEICRNKGIKMISGKLSSGSFPVKDFDIITSFEVIEHINNPREELHHISELLRKGGLFYCTTPNFNSLLRYYLKTDYNIIEYPEHLSYYTRKTLNRAVRENGFKNIKFLSTGISITRIRSSGKSPDEKPIATDNPDEKLRENMNRKWYLGMAKSIVNRFLTLSDSGMTLKGYYVKE